MYKGIRKIKERKKGKKEGKYRRKISRVIEAKHLGRYRRKWGLNRRRTTRNKKNESIRT